MKGTDAHTARWRSYLKDCGNVLDFVEPMQVSGRVTRVAGLVMECVGLKLAVGSACTIPVASGARIEAEVVGFEGDKLFLMPQSDVEGVVPGSRVFPVEASVPKPGTVPHPRRRPMDRARATFPSAGACWAASSTAPAARWTARVPSSRTIWGR